MFYMQVWCFKVWMMLQWIYAVWCFHGVSGTLWFFRSKCCDAQDKCGDSGSEIVFHLTRVIFQGRCCVSEPLL